MSLTERLLELALATFAVYRISHMLAIEDGPFDLLAWFRDQLKTDRQQTWLQRGFACPYCISFWAALVAAIPLAIRSQADPVRFFLLWFGVAGMAFFLLKRSYP